MSWANGRDDGLNARQIQVECQSDERFQMVVSTIFHETSNAVVLVVWLVSIIKKTNRRNGRIEGRVDFGPLVAAPGYKRKVTSRGSSVDVCYH